MRDAGGSALDSVKLGDALASLFAARVALCFAIHGVACIVDSNELCNLGATIAGGCTGCSTGASNFRITRRYSVSAPWYSS